MTHTPEPNVRERWEAEIAGRLQRLEEFLRPRPLDQRNIRVLYDGERTMTLCAADGVPLDGGVIVMPILIDRGVYRGDLAYARGDVVSFAGSLFIAQTDQPSTPEDGSGTWRLAVKRGRDAKGR